LGEGKIRSEEMPVPPDTNKKYIRYAPGFGGASTEKRLAPYTVDALAHFLGEVQDNGRARESFRHAPGFGSSLTTESFVPYTVVSIAKFLGKGKISAKEMPVDPTTKKETIRHMISTAGDHPYTIASVAPLPWRGKGKRRGYGASPCSIHC
jgi:hypothetical protein